MAQNKLPNSKVAITKVETLAEWYILVDSLLFKITPTLEKETAILAIPEKCADKIITLYHSSLVAGHQEVIKTYLTTSDNFFILNLKHYLRPSIKRCHICQLAHNAKPATRQVQTRICPNYSQLSRLSMDLEGMPRSYIGHKYILCVIYEVTNYLITVPIHQAKSEEVGDAFIENVISKCVPEYIVMDQDSIFMSSLRTYLLKKFDIKIKTAVPYNHQSLQDEPRIKSLSNSLTKHLTNLGQIWPKYWSLATFAYNTFDIPNLGNHSPYELILGRKHRSLLNLESTPNVKVSGSIKEYYDLLNKRLKYLHKLLLDFKSKRLAMINKDRTFSSITVEI